MADTMSIKITGLEELSQMLTEESVRTAKRYLVNMAKKAAVPMLDAMEQTVPVDTGKLEGGLGFQTRFSGGDQTTLTVKIGPDASGWYGSFQEFGTKYQQPPKHWVENAWNASKDDVLQAFVDEAKARLADMKAK